LDELTHRTTLIIGGIAAAVIIIGLVAIAVWAP
jgi:hypothetical protein